VSDGPFTTVSYSQPDTGDLSVDVFRPEINSRHCVVLIFRGGVPADLHIYAARDHGFDLAPSMLAATVRATTSFLERTVTNWPELDEEADRFSFLRLLQTQAG